MIRYHPLEDKVWFKERWVSWRAYKRYQRIHGNDSQKRTYKIKG